jgi:tRNA(Ile)-lysidine synthetase-like protein
MMLSMAIMIDVDEGPHVLAVSGGVDSVVLLDLFSKQSDTGLIVAHFDHGIRNDSDDDRLFVAQLAKKYDLPFEYGEAKLGSGASEALARKERYEFLKNVKAKYKAKDIVTAHHQDDLLETAIINLKRGTGRRGLSSLRSHENLQRPLLGVSKADLIAYAKIQGLVWREDETNTDPSYLRNYIRHQILPKFNKVQRDNLLHIIASSTKSNDYLDTGLAKLLKKHIINGRLDRQWFILLPHDVAKEMMATWLRQNGLASFDRRTIDRLVVASKTFRANTQVDIYNDYSLVVTQKQLALTSIDR